MKIYSELLGEEFEVEAFYRQVENDWGTSVMTILKHNSLINIRKELKNRGVIEDKTELVFANQTGSYFVVKYEIALKKEGKVIFTDSFTGSHKDKPLPKGFKVGDFTWNDYGYEHAENQAMDKGLMMALFGGKNFKDRLHSSSEDISGEWAGKAEDIKKSPEYKGEGADPIKPKAKEKKKEEKPEESISLSIDSEIAKEITPAEASAHIILTPSPHKGKMIGMVYKEGAEKFLSSMRDNPGKIHPEDVPFVIAFMNGIDEYRKSKA